MKVKIGDKIYDANEEPIMLIFEDNESIQKTAQNLNDMAESNNTKYCVFPEHMSQEEAREFMKTS